MESKRNETFGIVIFQPNVTQETWTLLQEAPEAVTRVGGAPLGAKNLIPPPQLSVSTRSHLGACSGAPPEGASITEGFYINTIASPIKCE